jgi:hypothetical protein
MTTRPALLDRAADEGLAWPRARTLFAQCGWQGLVKRLKYRLRRAGAGALKKELMAPARPPGVRCTAATRATSIRR